MPFRTVSDAQLEHEYYALVNKRELTDYEERVLDVLSEEMSRRGYVLMEMAGIRRNSRGRRYKIRRVSR